MGQAIAEAALITFVPLCLLKGGPDDYGTEQSLFFFGGTTFTLVILLANSKVRPRAMQAELYLVGSFFCEPNGGHEAVLSYRGRRTINVFPMLYTPMLIVAVC